MKGNRKIIFRGNDGFVCTCLGWNFAEVIEGLTKELNKHYKKSFSIRSNGEASVPQVRRLLENNLDGDTSVYVYNDKLKRWI